jgi:hypothetical protein
VPRDRGGDRWAALRGGGTGGREKGAFVGDGMADDWRRESTERPLIRSAFKRALSGCEADPTGGGAVDGGEPMNSSKSMTSLDYHFIVFNYLKNHKKRVNQ